MKCSLRMLHLACGLALALPALALEGRGPVKAEEAAALGPTNSFAESFWYGTTIPQSVVLPTPNGPVTFPVAAALRQVLTQPLGTNPISLIDALTYSLALYDGTGSDRGATVYQPDRAWKGYTLLSALSGHEVNGQRMFSILIDMDGTIVKEWPIFGFPAKMLPGGYIMGGAGAGLEGHQEQGFLVELDWCGNPVWQWPPTAAGVPGRPGVARQHHDYQREGNPVGYYAPGLKPNPLGGKTLILTHDNPPLSDTKDIHPAIELEDDTIYEVGWDGAVLWKWEPYKHIAQMGFTPLAIQAIKDITVGAPAGLGGGAPESDWQHINAAAYLGPNKLYDAGDLRFHPDNVIWDGRSSNIIAIVARHDHPAGKWKSGDIVWRIGPNYGPGNPEYRIGQIIGQHHAHMIPRGLPGAGNILVFDNGGLAGFGELLPGLGASWPAFFRNYSRVIEIDPQTLDVVWEYRLENPGPGERKFFSWFISSAQRLPNGNTLIDEGADGRVFEVTRSGEIVWEYIWKSTVGPGSLFSFGNAVYRAYRVPYEWTPQDKTCPAPVAAQ